MMISSQALALRYEANISEAQWLVTSSPFECRMSQPIPALGVAKFYHQAGDNLHFEVQADSQLPVTKDLALSLVPPLWNRQLDANRITVLNQTESGVLRIDGEIPDSLIRGLLFGYAVELSHATARAQRDSVTVSPVRFRESFRDFQTCMAQLLPYNFDQIARSKIMFSAGQENLTEKNRRDLKDVARYVLADKEVNAIYVDGYTDNVGKRFDNIELSRKRAEEVALYLIHLGVNPDIIALRYHGDYYPLAPNNSDANRAKNRRVTVRLDKVPEASVREQWYDAITQNSSPKPVDVNP